MLLKQFLEKRKGMILMKKSKGIGKFLVGAAIGAGLGILFAPKKGSETRKDLKNKFDELVSKAKQIDANEVKDNILNKIEEIKTELAELDKEKVLKIAKEQAKMIQKKASELVEYAKEKATPVVMKAADAARNKAIEVTKEVLKKLEQEA